MYWKCFPWHKPNSDVEPVQDMMEYPGSRSCEKTCATDNGLGHEELRPGRRVNVLGIQELLAFVVSPLAYFLAEETHLYLGNKEGAKYELT